VFDDRDGNGLRRDRESGVAGASVWVDVNDNGRYDRREPRAITNAEGGYWINKVPAGFERAIRCQPRQGWTFTRPGGGRAGVHAFPGKAAERPVADFAVANDTQVGGIAFRERNGYSGYQGNVVDVTDELAFGTTIYADLNNNRRLDDAEPRDELDSDGRYVLRGLFPVGTAIRVFGDERIALPGKGKYVVSSVNTRSRSFNFQFAT
jgi:hypothetical protein